MVAERDGHVAGMHVSGDTYSILYGLKENGQLEDCA
jgi:hypothetical protein